MYSQRTLQYFMDTSRTGKLPSPTCTGRAADRDGEDANRIAIALRIKDNRIQEARHQTFGCPGMLASGAALAELLGGMSVDKAQFLDAACLNAKLGGLPPARRSCADLAIQALRNALAQCSC